MSKKIILVGDSTSHGGSVISGSSTHTISGKAIARQGDLVSCPKHGDNKIIEGEANYLIDGIPVGLDGHSTECGAVLIGSTSAYVGD